ncbi:MAG TPA: hypothetical protein VF815_15960 [Myxococcaceae bacterium]|jgi:hypothetical protein
MQALTAKADAQRLPRDTSDAPALEDVASELLYPLTVIRLNAEELLSQFQAGNEEATTVDAALTLLRSVEQMSHIVQVLMQDSPPAPSAGSAEPSGRTPHLVG